MDYNYLNLPGQANHHHPAAEYVHPAPPHSQHALYHQQPSGTLPLHQAAQVAGYAPPHHGLQLPSHYRLPLPGSSQASMQIDRALPAEIGRNHNVAAVTASGHDLHVHTSLHQMQTVLTNSQGPHMGYPPQDSIAPQQSQSGEGAVSIVTQLPSVPPTMSLSTVQATSAPLLLGSGTPSVARPQPSTPSVAQPPLLTPHTVPDKSTQCASASNYVPVETTGSPFLEQPPDTQTSNSLSPPDSSEAGDVPVKGTAEKPQEEQEPVLGDPLPKGLKYRELGENSVCVIAEEVIAKGVRFGPFQGAFGKGPIHFNNIHSWEMETIDVTDDILARKLQVSAKQPFSLKVITDAEEVVKMMFIVGEGICIDCKTTDARKAVVHLLAAYYLFGRHYPAIYGQLLGFLQQHIVMEPYPFSKGTNFQTFSKKFHVK